MIKVIVRKNNLILRYYLDLVFLKADRNNLILPLQKNIHKRVLTSQILNLVRLYSYHCDCEILFRKCGLLVFKCPGVIIYAVEVTYVDIFIPNLSFPIIGNRFYLLTCLWNPTWIYKPFIWLMHFILVWAKTFKIYVFI